MMTSGCCFKNLLYSVGVLAFLEFSMRKGHCGPHGKWGRHGRGQRHEQADHEEKEEEVHAYKALNENDDKMPETDMTKFRKEIKDGEKSSNAKKRRTKNK